MSDQPTQENVQNRRVDIPGKGELIRSIRSINTEIQKIDDSIRSHAGRIAEIIKKDRENSPRNIIYTKLSELTAEVKLLRDEKKKILDEIEFSRKKIDDIKGELGTENLNHLTSEETIESKVADLNHQLISERITPQEEKRIAGELTSLRLKKSKLGGMRESVTLLKTLEQGIRENREKLSKINKIIAEKSGEINVLKKERDELNESSKNKHPEIDSLNDKIKVLKEQKSKQLENREEKRGEVHALEVEFKKLENDILLAKEQETVKDGLRAEIKGKNAKIAEIKNEMAEFDATVFDNMIFAIEHAKKTKNFMLPVELFSMLLKFGIPMPSNDESACKALEMLNKLKNGSDSSLNDRATKLNSRIEEIKRESLKLQQQLDEMPESDVELLRKGGYYRRNTNRNY